MGPNFSKFSSTFLSMNHVRNPLSKHEDPGHSKTSRVGAAAILTVGGLLTFGTLPAAYAYFAFRKVRQHSSDSRPAMPKADDETGSRDDLDSSRGGNTSSQRLTGTSVSSPISDADRTEEEAIKVKSRNIFECKSRTKGKHGYTYTLKESDPYGSTVFPALEPDMYRVAGTFTRDDQQSKSLIAVLKKLGYSVDKENKEVTFPDPKELQGCWNALRENPKYQHLPEIDFIESPGIASDSDFVSQFYSTDKITLIISSEEEFSHDHFYHVIPTLDKILSMEDTKNGSFTKEWKATQEEVKKQHHEILRRSALPKEHEEYLSEDEVKRAVHLLGIAVDSFTAQHTTDFNGHPSVKDGLLHVIFIQGALQGVFNNEPNKIESELAYLNRNWVDEYEEQFGRFPPYWG